MLAIPFDSHSGFYFPPAAGWSPSLSREGNVLRAPPLESFNILNFYKRIFCFPLVKPYVLHHLENPHRLTPTANNVCGLTAYHRHIYWLILY